MISGRFVKAAIVAIAVPALLLLHWALLTRDLLLVGYVVCLALLGVIVGQFVSTKIRRRRIGGPLSCILAGILGLITSAYWLRDFSFGDTPEIAVMVWLGCGAFAGIIGLAFGLGIGQPARGRDQR